MLRNVLGQAVLEINESDIKVVDLSIVPNGNYVLTISSRNTYSTHNVTVLK